MHAFFELRSGLIVHFKIVSYAALSCLCWFQTNLPLAALPLRRVIIACCFRVAALSGNAALGFHPAAIAPKLNRSQLSAICRGGKAARLSIYWLDAACRLVIPLRQVALAQLYNILIKAAMRQAAS